MKVSDMGSAATLVAIGGFAAWQAKKLSLGGPHAPGAGFFPFYLSLLLIVLAAVIFFQGLREKPVEEVAAPRKLRVVAVLAAFFIYPFLLEPLGYLITTFMLMLLCISMMLKRAWWFAPAVAGVISFFSYLVFKTWLQVLLPKGLLGF
jgi:putative tricarboxylic transport membrane protein